jgi:glycosyltransferase involved in cell wall biosynthesis
MNRLAETRECLQMYLPFVDKVVIVDGGSVDDTIFYMRNWAAKEPKINFYLCPWKDQFSEQRNNYLKYVPDNTWAIVSDPDEVFMPETLQSLTYLIQEAERTNKDMIGFQCRSVSYHGPDRTWESLDDYWKRLLFKKYPGTHYVGNPHESLANHPHQIMDTKLIYEHRKQENVIWIRGCFTPGQRIITNGGYKLVEEVQAGDQVVDMNGELQSVSEVTKREVDEEIVSIRRTGAPEVCMTKEHPVWVANSLPCKIDSKAIRYRPFLKKSHESKEAMCCQDPNLCYENFGWLDAGELNYRHVFHYPKLNKSIAKPLPLLKIYDKHSNQYERNEVVVPLTPDIFRLLGYYLSEGSLDYNNGLVEFTFSIYERQTLVEDLSKISTGSFGRALSISDKIGNGCNARLHCIDLVKWIDSVFGQLSYAKKIPLDYIAGFTDEQMKELLKGLFLGDGTKSDYVYSITLASPDLSMSIWVMLVELGFRPFIHEIPLETLNRSNSGVQHKHSMFRVSISTTERKKFEDDVLCSGTICFNMKGRTKARPSKFRREEFGKSLSIWKAAGSIQSCATKITTRQYKGPVYNIEVENSHSYCLPYMAVHNCRNFIAGGGGPNLGARNPHWVKLRQITDSLGLKSWHEFERYMLAGNIDQRIKDEFIKYVGLTEIFPGQTDGLSEMRECYKTYFRIYHNEEEPAELKGKHIP